MNDEIYRTVCRNCRRILQKAAGGWHHLKFLGTSSRTPGVLDLAMDQVCTPHPVETDPPRSFPSFKRHYTQQITYSRKAPPKKKNIDKGGMV